MNRILIFTILVFIVMGCDQSGNHYESNSDYLEHDSLIDRANDILTDTLNIDSIRIDVSEKSEIIDLNSVELEKRARIIEQQKKEIEQIKLQYKKDMESIMIDSSYYDTIR